MKTKDEIIQAIQSLLDEEVCSDNGVKFERYTIIAKRSDGGVRHVSFCGDTETFLELKATDSQN